MKFRALHHSAALSLAALFASASFAKGIQVDESIVCPSAPIAQTSAGLISLGGSNSASSGVAGLSVWACNDTLAMDTEPNPFFTFNNTTGVFNTWVALKGQPASYVESHPLSTLQGDGLVTLVSQVSAYQLTGIQSGYGGNLTSVNGDYEVQFDYDNYPLGGGATCPASHASLTWGGKTWLFTGAGGVGLCDLNSTNDFLFSNTGALLGYLDTSGNLVHSAPPGWVSSVSAPEPDTIALSAAAGVLMLLGLRRRRESGA